MTADTPTRPSRENSGRQEPASEPPKDDTRRHVPQKGTEPQPPTLADAPEKVVEELQEEKKDRSPERPPQPEPEKAHPFDGTLDF
jgi:hypothetical protein